MTPLEQPERRRNRRIKLKKNKKISVRTYSKDRQNDKQWLIEVQRTVNRSPSL